MYVGGGGISPDYRKILLVGDSQAYAWADGVIPAAKKLGYAVVVSSISGCPFGSLNSTGNHVVNCKSWQSEVLNYALKEKPDLVIIANLSSGYTMPESPWRTLIDENGVPANSQNANWLYFDSLFDVVLPLKEKNIPVLIIQNIPSPPIPVPTGAKAGKTIFSRYLSSSAGPQMFSGYESVKHSERSRAVETNLSIDVGVNLYDPFRYLCNPGISQCRSFVNGFPIYLDGAHLTAQGAASLAKSLQDSIESSIKNHG
jgi:hypothetical protein